MFKLNEDNSIYITRGDIAYFSVQIAVEGTDELYVFQPGEVVRFKVFEKKGCDCVVLQKDFPITQETDRVEIFLCADDTRIGSIIHKPKDYWYEVEINPGVNPQTVIGYDDENGACIFRLFPEGKDADPNAGLTPDDIPLIDTELDTTSGRPVANSAVATAIFRLENAISDANILNQAAYKIAIGIKEAADRGDFNGKTPVKGQDYFTDDDIADIVYQVAEDLDRETWTFSMDDGSVVHKAVMTAEVLQSVEKEIWKFAMDDGTVVEKRVVLYNG